jgi:hypothetical protein
MRGEPPPGPDGGLSAASMASYSSGGGTPVTKIPGRGRYPWDFIGVDRPDDLADADWLTQLPYPGQQVRNWVPEVFDAYARVFFPIRTGRAFVAPLTWAGVARRNGWVVHAEMTAEAICRPSPGKEMDPPDITASDLGFLQPEQLAGLATILTSHTTTQETTFFALWEGYGDLMVGLEEYTDGKGRRRVREPLMLTRPERRYLVYQGPVDAWSVFDRADHHEVPDLWWPKDKAWCLVTDVDFGWVYVGGSKVCIDDILAAHGIEALPTEPAHRVGITSDLVNDPDGTTWPEHLR